MSTFCFCSGIGLLVGPSVCLSDASDFIPAKSENLLMNAVFSAAVFVVIFVLDWLYMDILP